MLTHDAANEKQKRTNTVSGHRPLPRCTAERQGGYTAAFKCSLFSVV